MKTSLSLLLVLFLSVLFIGCQEYHKLECGHESIHDYKPLLNTTNSAFDMLSIYKDGALSKLGLYDEKLKWTLESYEKLIGKVIREHPNLSWFNFTEQLHNRKLQARLERIYLKVKD